MEDVEDDEAPKPDDEEDEDVEDDDAPKPEDVEDDVDVDDEAGVALELVLH